MEEVITFFGGEIAGEKVRDRCCGGSQFFANKWATERLSSLILEKSKGTLVVFCPLVPHGPQDLLDGTGEIVYLTELVLYMMGENKRVMNILDSRRRHKRHIGRKSHPEGRPRCDRSSKRRRSPAASWPASPTAGSASRTFLDEISGHPAPHGHQRGTDQGSVERRDGRLSHRSDGRAVHRRG